MKVHRVLETSLYAQNLDAAERFYTRVLGLEVYSRVEDRHVFFRCGSAMLLVFNPDKTEQEEDWHGCRGRGHVAWAIPSHELEEWRQWLRAADVPIYSEVSWPKGGHSLYFRDPAGNSLELATLPTWGMAENA
jgi:catechol 2,3-dioxygenase-like lactoylglutathione lyase family enzyme